MKKILICISILIIILITVLVIVLNNKTDYIVKVEIIDIYSPDRKIVLYKQNEIIDFKETYYMDDTILTDENNHVVSKSDLIGLNKIKVKLLNDEIVIAKIVEEGNI